MASDKNTMPKGTTHICMNITHAFHAKRVHNGWCLQDGEGGWVFCGEEVEGYKVDIRTGIVWQESDKEDSTRVLASVIRLKGERAIGVEGLRIPSGFSDVDHLITQRFVDGWEPAATPVDGPVNPARLGRRIPVKFSCAVAQYAYDNGHPVDAFPRPGFYGRMAAHLARDLRELKAEVAARELAPVSWRQMSSAPRDGQMLRLVVRFTEHSTEDSELAYTIGSNNLDNDEIDEWQFAGWCWTHDHFTTGKGEPIGWLPMLLGGDK